MLPEKSRNYETISVEEVLRELNTNANTGLSDAEVNERAKRYGYNEVPEKKEHPAKKFAKKFWGFTAWMLEAAMIVCIILGLTIDPARLVDAYIIAALLVVNALIGFIHEEHAARAVELLKQRLQVMARVLRNGVWQALPARFLVPGDIIRIRAGDIVPADAKIITSEEVEVDQSALTGESMPVIKRKGDVMYSGSILRRGEATAVVVRTGLNTYFGKTVQLVQTARPKLHMEEIISKVVSALLIMVSILVIVMFPLTYFYLHSLMFLADYVLPLAIMLIVFAVPVALPAMFTVTMAVGAQEMARKGALITKLSAVEDSASMTVLCADKTGTLTYNRLTVTHVVPMKGYSENEVLLYGALASQEANQDPIDLAFIRAAKERKLLINDFEVKEFKPFDPSTRRTEALVVDRNNGGRIFRVTKGAVRTLAEDLCRIKLGEDVESIMNSFAASGYRTLGVAKSEDGDHWEMVGLVALYDIPREDTPKLIQELRNLGVRVKMLTGDAKPIAREIAKIIGLGENVMSGKELKELLEKEPQKAAKLAEETDVFAEIYPEDKYFIVKSLQASRQIVGMTGDGVNDSPALKQAEVGIAVSNATDVAKAAASVVLTVEGLSGIVELVRIGRATFQRIITWILNKVVKTFEIAVFVTLAFIISALFWHNPIYAVSALDVTLFLFLIDFVTISLSTDNAKGSPTPEKWDVPKLVKLGVGLGIFTVAEMFGLLFLALDYFHIGNVHALHTYYFTAIMYMGVLTPFIVRERGPFWVSRPGKWLTIASVIDMVVVAFIALTGLPGPWGHLLTPITWQEFAAVALYCLFVNFAINDRAKLMLGRLGISR
jgi:H+-transporting ATPase